MKHKILPTAVLTTMIALGGVSSPALAGPHHDQSHDDRRVVKEGELGLGHIVPGPKVPLIKSPNGSLNYPETHEHEEDLVAPPSFGVKDAQDPQFGAAATASSQGDIKVTMVTVKLADRTLTQTRAMSAAAMDKSVADTSTYWKSMSNNRISTSIASKRLEHNSSAKSTDDYPTIMNTIRREIGWTDGPYKALVVFIPVDSLSYGGYTGYLGAGWSSAGIGGSVLMPNPSSLTTPVMAHEYGHMLGLLHANSLQCTNGRADVGINSASQWADSSCTSREYGDTLDLMGASQVSMPAINSFFWDAGGFGRGDEILDAGVAAGSKTYTLKPWGGTESRRAVKFLDPKSQETYYLELRSPSGYDASIATAGNRGVKIVKEDIENRSWAPKSVNLNPSTKPWSSYYNPNHAWQAGSTFTTHGGVKVSINSVSDGSASVTVTSGSPAETAIAAKRAQSTFLGNPTSGVVTGLKNGGAYQNFQNGSILWSPSTGAQVSKGGIRTKWASTGFENGRLGYPTSDEVATVDGGVYQNYEGGAILWHPTAGTAISVGAIRTNWLSANAERGILRFPTSDEVPSVRSGAYQNYQGGAILWSPATGAKATTNGDIRSEWLRGGAEVTGLGYPTSEKIGGIKNGGVYQNFERGSIIWSPQTGAKVSMGAIRTAWASTGFENGRLGYPTSNEYITSPGTVVQDYQGGRITWTSQRGAIITYK